jgi:hypothetical protein
MWEVEKKCYGILFAFEIKRTQQIFLNCFVEKWLSYSRCHLFKVYNVESFDYVCWHVAITTIRIVSMSISLISFPLFFSVHCSCLLYTAPSQQPLMFLLWLQISLYFLKCYISRIISCTLFLSRRKCGFFHLT